MKTFKVILFVGALIILTAGLSSAAIVVSIESAAINVGGATIIDVTLAGASSPLVDTFDFTIPFDSSGLSASNAVAGSTIPLPAYFAPNTTSNQVQAMYSPFVATVPSIPDGTIAQFTVTGLSAGSYPLNFSQIHFSYEGDPVPFSTAGGIIMVNAAAVPIPAAAWLLGSGLVGLVALRRRQRK